MSQLIKLAFFSIIVILSCNNRNVLHFNMENLYPWCIVAYDSLERSPAERISMMKELGFKKYAYDWRDKHLDDMKQELLLAKENEIEVISVWLWLNAKRDSLGMLSPSNTRIFEILEKSKLETTLWLSFSNNFFKGLTQKESMKLAIGMVDLVSIKASKINCDVALYNHKGWFGNPFNQVEIVKALPHHDLSMVYNFHHAHDYLDDFPQVVKTIMPYLSAVNVNGMKKDSPKILPIGSGDLEAKMIDQLVIEGYDGPWGILGHVEGVDVKMILEENIQGLHTLVNSD